MSRAISLKNQLAEKDLRLGKLLKTANDLPLLAGVYRFFANDNRLLYIGKAKNLKKRVVSYFRKNSNLSITKQRLVSLTAKIEFTVVNNETEALILEAQTIKKYQPPYNIDLKDDKNWLYAMITADEWPQIITVRKPERFKKIKAQVKFFGPFVSAQTLRRNLTFLKKLFPLFSPQGALVELNKKPHSAYHLGRYLDKPTASKKDWQQALNLAGDILSGKTRHVNKLLKTKLARAIKNKQFEEAGRIRDSLLDLQQFTVHQQVSTLSSENADYWAIAENDFSSIITLCKVREGNLLDSLNFNFTKQTLTATDALENFLELYYTSDMDLPTKIISEILPKQQPELPKNLTVSLPRLPRQKKLLALATKNAQEKLNLLSLNSKVKKNRAETALLELTQKFNLPNIPQRMEAYDISNIQGNFAVGSMVVFTDGIPDKKEYRHFKIKTIKSANDFLMIKEIVSRRAKRADWPEPDLLIIDGGMLQLNQAILALNAANKTWPIISLAKKREEIYLPHKIHPLIIPTNSSASLLLQAARDEAHRFAINYYRKLHSKSLR
jgi:excinuclease ABC subunit C